ncbi:MAG TPA: perosamine synthetase, partial [Gemmataceae bacterium]|nr:perosamine synthetase [Gemmataceae bacterium]
LHVGRSSERYKKGSALTEAECAHRECLILHHPVLLGSEDDRVEIEEAFRKIQRCADDLRQSPSQ